MPLNKKGKKIMKAMKKQYGADEGEAVFYASKNKGVIDDVERKALGGKVAKKKLTDLTGDGKITRKDFLRGAGVPGFKEGKTVKASNRQKAQKQRDKQARKLALEEMEGRTTRSKDRSALDRFYDDVVPDVVKAPAVVKAKRARAEKKVQEEMGSFESGGVVKAAILIMDSGPQPEKAQVKGTKFSGNY